MVKCKYKIEELNFECPFDSEKDNEYCYWHKRVDEKSPTKDQLKELKKYDIKGVYLQLASLSGVNLSRTNLQYSNLYCANLSRADLRGADLRNSLLASSTLDGASLKFAKLKEANLSDAKLRRSDLSNADLRGARLWRTNFENSFLEGTRFDSNSYLFNSHLIGANLYHSYIDETKTFRDATIFLQKEDIYEKEINERVADDLSNKLILNANMIEKNNQYLFLKLEKAGFVKGFSNKVIIYEDVKEASKDDDNISEIIKNLDELLFENTVLSNPNNIENFVPEAYIDQNFIYKNYKKELYDASYDVYNKLYNFYCSDGDFISAKHAHYRRGEAYRKLLIEKGWWCKLRSWVFDWLILKQLAGYGDDLRRPITISFIGIISFAASFFIIDGITVEGRNILWYDYFYLSLTTFTGLGFSNVQPDITVPLMQFLVMFESVFGVTMVALIIFVITYQISR